jgi:putative glycosyltransferase (TIGR04348 family)
MPVTPAERRARSARSTDGLPLRPTLILVTPYLASANNGNWRTASRWARMLAPRFRVILQSADAPVIGAARERAVALVALHARRSRDATAAWKRAHPDRALVVALTGTDLYRDIPAGDADALASLADADRLIVLQSDALGHLPAVRRAKASVVMQSARTLSPFASKASTRLNAIVVGHLRAEKDPLTAIAAWRHLPADVPATLTLVGGALDPALADDVRRACAADARVRWLGAREHGWTRQAIRRAHVLVVASRLEGGANVVVEALTAGTPVIATRMSGNVGMLGEAYPGYFEVGDARGLATAIARAARDPAWLAQLAAHGDRRARLMTPEAEARALEAAIDAALRGRSARGARMVGRHAPARRAAAKARR